MDPEGSSTIDLHDEGHPAGITRLSYGRHLRVLLVDDRADSVERFRRSADDSVLDVRVEVVGDVGSALSRLRRASSRRDGARAPDVVVTGLADGDNHRLLADVRAEDALDVPVVVLTRAADPEAERRSFALGAAGHLVSPSGEYERLALIHALPDYVPRARAAHVELESHQR
jgi:CheY-like chemotaxis protein